MTTTSIQFEIIGIQECSPYLDQPAVLVSVARRGDGRGFSSHQVDWSALGDVVDSFDSGTLGAGVKVLAPCLLEEGAVFECHYEA